MRLEHWLYTIPLRIRSLQLVRDIGYALRILRKNPSFAALTIFTLALCIGANTALFSLLDAVLLRSLPVREPHRLFFLKNVSSDGRPNGAPPYPCFERFRESAQFISGMAAFQHEYQKVRVEGLVEQVVGEYASGNYFDVLGVRPALGRLLSAADERLDPPVAVISYGYWQRRFGSDPAVLGRVIGFGNRSLTIVGVSGPEFFGIAPGMPVDITFPITLFGPPLRDKGAWWFDIIARLKPSIPVERARAEVDRIFQNFMSDVRMSAEYRHIFHHMDLAPASKGLDALRQRFSRPLLVLMGIAGLVLLIGCANIANLLLARAAARRREFALRLALGAGRGRLIRQLLTETMLLLSCGAAVALVFADWAGEVLVSYFAAGRSPVIIDLHLDPRVLAFTAGLSLFSGAIFGLVPALSAARTEPNPMLKQAAGWVAVSGARIGPAQLFVLSQVTLSVILLVGAGLFVRTLVNLKSLDPGFRAEGVLTASIDPTEVAADPSRRSALWTQLLERVRAIPGVHSASLSVLTPLSERDRGGLVTVPGFQPQSEHDAAIHQNHVSDGYFETLGIPVLLGRTFAPGDRTGAPKVAILNETAVRFYFGDRSPIGARLDFGRSPISDGIYQVVGVVRDVKHNSLRAETPRTVYLPVFQPLDNLTRLTLSLRTYSDPAAFVPAVRHQISALGPDILVSEILTLQQQVDASLVQERLVSTLSGFFGVLGLLLSAVGLYGVLSQAVVQKTHEIGIRMALGARAGELAWMVLWKALLLTAGGVIIGVPFALLAFHRVTNLLYGLKAADPRTLVAAAGLLLAVAMAASYLPARRTSHIDPIVALREE